MEAGTWALLEGMRWAYGASAGHGGTKWGSPMPRPLGDGGDAGGSEDEDSAFTMPPPCCGLGGLWEHGAPLPTSTGTSLLIISQKPL